MKKLSTILIALYGLLQAVFPAQGAQSIFSMQTFSLKPGQTADVPVFADTAECFTALMFDVVFPEEVRLKSVAAGSAAAASHNVTFSTLPNGECRVVAFSPKNETFKPAGSLVILTIEDGDKAAGNDSIIIQNIIITAPDGKETEIAPCSGIFTASVYGIRAAAPSISQSGETITIDGNGNTCYFTTDSSEPSRFGTPYTEPFTVSHNCEIRAAAVEDGKDKSTASVLTVNSFQAVQPVIAMSNDTCTVSCSDKEATIHYTTDGSDPTDSHGSVYTGAFTVKSNVTVKACASRQYFNTSAIASYDVDFFTAAAPEIIFKDKTVTLKSSTPDAVIHYTLDGSIPTGTSTVYAKPFTIGQNTLVKAIAEKKAYNQSPVSEAYLTLPTVSLAPYSIKPGKKVKTTMSCQQDTAVTALMFDIVFPDEMRIIKVETGKGASASHSAGFSAIDSRRFRIAVFSTSNAPFLSNENLLDITIEGGDMSSGTHTLTIENVVATDAVGNDTEGFSSNAVCQASKNGIQATQPSISVQNDTLTMASSDSCYYTMDGSEPSRFSALYTGPVVLTRNCTIKAIAAASWKDKSATVSQSVTSFIVADPTIEWDNKKFTVSCPTAESTIFYTTDGSDPLKGKAKRYNTPFSTKGNCTVMAYAQRDGYTSSNVVSYTVDTFTVATPVLTLHEDTLLLSVSTPGAKLYYTTDNSTPTSKSTLYTGPVKLDADYLIKAIAVKEYYNNSEVVEKQLIWFKVATPEIKMLDDSVFALTCATAGATIYYTTDGSEPSTASAKYTEPLIMLHDFTIKAFATKKQQSDSDTLTQDITVIINLVRLNRLKLAGEENGLLTLTLVNRTPFTAIMLDISLPPSLAVIPDSQITASSRLTPSHSITYHESSDNVYRFVIFSSANIALGGDNGPLFSIPVYAVNSAKGGTYDIKCTDIICTTAEAEEIQLSPYTGSFLMNPYNETVQKPVISVDGQLVRITCTTPEAEIHYTIDGTYPTSHSTLYTDSFTIDGNCTIQAIGIKDSCNQSTAAVYNVNNLKVATPAISLTGGNTVSMGCVTEGATIWYSLKKGKNLKQYTSPFVLTRSTTIKAVATREGWLSSDTLTRTVTMAVNQHLEVSNVTCYNAGDVWIHAYLRNTKEITSYQADIHIPDNFSIVEESLTPGSGADASHTIASATQSDGSLRVMCFSSENKALSDNGDAILSFRINVPEGISDGHYDLFLDNICISSIQGKETCLDQAHAVISVLSFSELYNIVYMVDNDEFSKVSLVCGAFVPPMAAPRRTGYTFSGWENEPLTMEAHDTTVYGHFTANKYCMTYLIDSTFHYSDSIRFGQAVTPLDYPSPRSGYFFSGWYVVPDVMPAHDVVVQGRFISDTASDFRPGVLYDVYSIYGKPVLRQAGKDDLNTLPGGLYIINGKRIHLIN